MLTKFIHVIFHDGYYFLLLREDLLDYISALSKDNYGITIEVGGAPVNPSWGYKLQELKIPIVAPYRAFELPLSMSHNYRVHYAHMLRNTLTQFCEVLGHPDANTRFFLSEVSQGWNSIDIVI